MSINLSGKRAFVTGGASGLGAAIVTEFIECGAKVVVADWNPDVEKIAEGLGAYGIRMDVSKEEDVEAAVKFAVEKLGGLDIAIASAGVGGDNYDIVNETMENWNKVNAIDYTGVMLTDKHCIKQMLAQGTGGSVINIASMFGLVAVPDNIAYSSAKSGVVNMSRAAAVRYADQAIRVNCVCPGVIKTPLISEEARQAYLGLHPAGRLGEPDEVACLCAFLCGDRATFITGAAIPIDGGYTAR